MNVNIAELCKGYIVQRVLQNKVVQAENGEKKSAKSLSCKLFVK